MFRPKTSKAHSLLASLAVCAALAASAGDALAHAVVTESSLKQNPIKINHATKVVLYFNSNVELALSKVFLVSKGDKFQSVEISKGKKPGEMIISVPALTEGDYALKYKVFAADGHLTEDVIRFRVAEQR